MSEGSSEPDLERTLLGAVLVTPELLGAAADIVTPADFAKHAHGVIWTALLRLNEDDRPLDATSLKHELAELGQLAAAGGAAYLGELLTECRGGSASRPSSTGRAGSARPRACGISSMRSRWPRARPRRAA